eukprot:NODE_18250_length_902_cov_8.430968.p3 GENE.NODE_18250_length_902_cov_8.430968~~NODE_18250_length_902_cov_8.430968.p3  ORF type:complete len:106 (-),score=25.48 NODE_18250_length_902_cov_8.430968:217-534(-)
MTIASSSSRWLLWYAEHVVILEFEKKKLPFVFKLVSEATLFKTCMEMLIKRAQQEQQRCGGAGAHGGDSVTQLTTLNVFADEGTQACSAYAHDGWSAPWLCSDHT